jgi:hypothetical protein
MSDVVSEVTNQGWLSRIGESIKGLLFGGLMFLAAFPLLWWNEGRAVQTYKSLQEGRGAVVSVQAEKVDSANEGRLVHLSGLATTTETLSDPVFRVSVPAIRLNRKAVTYQWVEQKKSEKRKKLGGGEETVTTYSYSKDWSDKKIDSSQFKEPSGHGNPASLPFESESWQAQKVTVGGFQLSDGLTRSIHRSVEVAFTQAGVDALPAAVKAKARLEGAALYIGGDPASPSIGDVKISFNKVPPADVSTIAQQTGARLGPYQTKAGDALEMLEPGVVTADVMFKSAESANTVLTWVLRLVGFFVMFFGMTLLLRPIRVVADVVPFFGTLVSMGLGLIAFAVAAPLTLLTIAIAWIASRPVLGVFLLLVVVALFGWLFARFAKQKRVVVPPLPAAAR